MSQTKPEKRAAWNKQNLRQFNFTVSKNKYPELIEFLEGKENISDYLKQLVIQDFEKNLEKVEEKA